MSPSPSTGFDRVPDPTVIKVSCHKSLVHRDTVKEFILKQARDAGLEGCRIIVKGLVNANTFIVKFDEELQRSLRKDKTMPDEETHFYNKKSGQRPPSKMTRLSTGGRRSMQRQDKATTGGLIKK